MSSESKTRLFDQTTADIPLLSMPQVDGDTGSRLVLKHDGADDARMGRSNTIDITSAEMSRRPPSAFNATEIAFGFRIYSISKIDNIGQCFAIDFRLFATWNDNTLPADKEVEDLRNSDCFIPFIEISNALELERIDMGIRTDGPQRVKWHCRYRAVLSTTLDLRMFPFDHHNLPITIRIPREIDRRRISAIVPDPKRTPSSTKAVMAQFVLQEWELHQPSCEVVARDFKFRILIPVRRLSQYFVINVIGIMFLFTGLAFTILLLEIDDVSSRENQTLTLILAVSAFRFLIQNTLPSTSYTSVLDKYFLSCFLMMFCIGIECGVVKYVATWHSMDIAAGIERIFIIILIILWGAVNVTFLGWSLWWQRTLTTTLPPRALFIADDKERA